MAKAYARAPILTINGSEDGFDGYRIGLNGFDNPLRDPKTEVVKNHIGEVSICLLLKGSSNFFFFEHFIWCVGEHRRLLLLLEKTKAPFISN